MQIIFLKIIDLTQFKQTIYSIFWLIEFIYGTDQDQNICAIKEGTRENDAVFLNIVTQVFVFLHSASCKAKKSKNIAAYNLVITNIENMFRGAKNIATTSGTYLHTQTLVFLERKEGLPIMLKISQEEIDAMKKFIEPIVPPDQYFVHFFKNFKGSPKENYKALLEMIMFKDITLERRKKMFYSSHKKFIRPLLDLLLDLAALFKTPKSIIEIKYKLQTLERDRKLSESKMANTVDYMVYGKLVKIFSLLERIKNYSKEGVKRETNEEQKLDVLLQLFKERLFQLLKGRNTPSLNQLSVFGNNDSDEGNETEQPSAAVLNQSLSAV